jgi:hypothetical protein
MPDTPVIQIETAQNGVLLFWSRATPGFILEEAANLADGAAGDTWRNANLLHQQNSSHFFVLVPASPGNRFFRLRRE